MPKKKYFDVHMLVDNDCKEGYSIFVEAESEQHAVSIIEDRCLYEEKQDLLHIDYIGEISEREFVLAQTREDENI